MGERAGGTPRADGGTATAAVAVDPSEQRRSLRQSGAALGRLSAEWGVWVVRRPLDVEGQVRRWLVRALPSRGGAVVGLLFFCTSLTPSLLPRTWLAQALISAVSTSAGYAIGVGLGWVLTRVVPRRWLPPPRVRRIVVRS